MATLTAPRGGIEVTLLPADPNGDVVGTGDGQRVAWRWHVATEGCLGEDATYYEVVEGPNRGMHGWVCRQCRTIVQTG